MKKLILILTIACTTAHAQDKKKVELTNEQWQAFSQNVVQIQQILSTSDLKAKDAADINSALEYWRAEFLRPITVPVTKMNDSETSKKYRESAEKALSKRNVQSVNQTGGQTAETINNR